MELRYQKCQFHKGTRKETLEAKGTLVPPKRHTCKNKAIVHGMGDSKNSPIVLGFLELTEKSKNEGLKNHL